MLERQSAANCLRIFWEGSYTAIINHPGMRNVNGHEHTAAFIKIVVNWWKILSGKVLSGKILSLTINYKLWCKTLLING